jgi:hypothetical protein
VDTYFSCLLCAPGRAALFQAGAYAEKSSA